jgi:hypothetical protein
VDGSVVAALVAAGGAGLTGAGGALGVVLARRSAREAAAQAGHASARAASAEKDRLGYDLLVLSIETAKADIERLMKLRAEDRADINALRIAVRECHAERSNLMAQVVELQRTRGT